MRADNVVNYGGITLINGMGLCLSRRDAVGRTVRSFALHRRRPPWRWTMRTVAVTPDAFLFRNWCFLRRCFSRPRAGGETPLCRNKVTLLPAMLRSGTLTRAFLRYLRRCRDTPVYIVGGIYWDIKDITVIDAHDMHGQQAN